VGGGFLACAGAGAPACVKAAEICLAGCGKAADLADDAANIANAGGQQAAAEAGTVVYRVWGGKSGAWGPSWTTQSPNLAGNAYRNLAGLPSGNTGQFVSTGVLTNPGAVQVVTSASSLHGNAGGWPEIVMQPAAAEKAIQLLSVGGANPPF